MSHQKASSSYFDVVQIIPELTQGGGEQSLIDIAKALDKTSARTLVISGGGKMSNQLNHLASQHLIIKQLGCRNPFIMFKNYMILRRFLQRYPARLIHVRSRLTAWLVYILHKTLPFKWICTWHGRHHSHNMFKKIYNSVLVRADATIATSQHMQKTIARDYQSYHPSLYTIPRGIDTDSFYPSQEKPRHKALVLLFPGRITPWKGQDFALTALKYLRDHFHISHWQAYFVGTAKQKKEDLVDQLRSRARKLSLSEHVHFIGHCDDMPTIYRMSDMVVIPSLSPEPFGRTIAEAQASGKLTLTLYPPLGNATYKNHINGFTVEGKTPFALARAIFDIIHLPEPYKEKIQTKARENILQHYTRTKMQVRTLHLYDQLLSTPSQASDLCAQFCAHEKDMLQR